MHTKGYPKDAINFTFEPFPIGARVSAMDSLVTKRKIRLGASLRSLCVSFRYGGAYGSVLSGHCAGGVQFPTGLRFTKKKGPNASGPFPTARIPTPMAPIKSKRKITLACDGCHGRNYLTFKNASVNPQRLELKKFCRKCGSHTLHKETK